VLVLIAVIVTNVIVNRLRGYEHTRGRFSFARWLAALNAAKWALAIPIVILGGIYSGVFTPTESAAVAVSIALVIGMLQKKVRLADFPAMLGTSARVCGVILPIIAVALLFSQALTVVDVPQKFVASVMSLSTDKSAVILLMLVIWIVAGMFMETSPCIVILGPLLWPLAQKIGLDQIHFSVYMITTLGLGFITPPFGLNLFVMAGLTRTPLGAIAAQSVPFVVAMIVVSIVIGFVPELSLWGVKHLKF
jgi:tripartite ATP-independent transporter DctM subunit